MPISTTAASPSTAELIDAPNVEPTAFDRRMGERGCRPHPGRVTTEDGTSRWTRGYLITDIRAATQASESARAPDDGQSEPRHTWARHGQGGL